MCELGLELQLKSEMTDMLLTFKQIYGQSSSAFALWLVLIVAKAEVRGRFLNETALCRKTREVLVGGAAALFGVFQVLE